jgi:nitrate/TMAO reductase-like tetraheme cytochrome c subunit
LRLSRGQFFPFSPGFGTGLTLFWFGQLARLSLLVGLAFWLGCARAEDIHTESRTPFLHNIPVRDTQGRLISPLPVVGEDGKPQEPKANPYSPAQTCGKCHDYDTISEGWHFNADSATVPPGRPGEPWILTDPATRTQIPLSYRGWAGTFKPSDLGLSDFEFVTNFSRHFPGGGPGEPDKIKPTDPQMGRMNITGKLEIDCLICHQNTGRYDHEARFNALRAQNFRWAPTIAAGLGVFASFKSAGSIADSWHPGRPVAATLPAIKYDRARFDTENNVLFQVSRRASVNNCYYCHTSETALGDARWHGDLDVHIKAGLLCVDCHRNGIDHAIVRGYEGEVRDRVISDSMIKLRVAFIQRNADGLKDDDARKLARQQLQSEAGQIETLTCRGCHTVGRLGSPRLVHKGLPPIHFVKLSCTACHSGPFPKSEPQVVHTSLAHKLGLPGPERGERTAPVILEPIFLRGADGKIAPFKMVWPSYWARLNGTNLIPMLPAEAAKIVNLPQPSSDEAARDPYNTKPLTDRQIQQVLQSFPAEPSKGEPVFIAAGKIYRLQKGSLLAAEDPAAKPYAWALAHDVRPASQALGARGCADCHATDAPMYFAAVAARGPVETTNGVNKEMWEMRGDDKTAASFFDFTFHFRPLLKCIVFAAALVVLGVLLHYGLRGLGALTARGKERP